MKTTPSSTVRGPLAAALLLLALGPACSQSGGVTPDSGGPRHWFFAPEGIAASATHVLVANTALTMEGTETRFGQGFVTVIGRQSRQLLARIETSRPNTSQIAVHGDRAYVVNAGPLRMEGGLALPAGPGSLDVLALSGPGAPRLQRTIELPLSSSDPRIGAYGTLALSPDGTQAYIGSGTRGDVFRLDLARGTLVRGADDPLVLFPTPQDENGLTVLRRFGDELAVLSFNTEELCLSADWDGDLGQRSCHSIRAQKELLSGAIDVARSPDGAALVLMSLANVLDRVEVSSEPFGAPQKLCPTGLANNRVVVHDGAAYIVNSLSSNLQRVDPHSGASTLPLAVLPSGSNPYDLVITQEPEGAVAWVTLNKSHQLALVNLQTGQLITVLGNETPGSDSGSPDAASDAGPLPVDASPTDSGPLDGREGDGAPPFSGGATAVVRVTYGDGAGLGQDQMPQVVLGAPQGQGDSAGSTDVLSLGVGGEIVLDFGPYDVVDGPGPDLIVFENPFLTGPYSPYAEPGIVGVSAGGTQGADFVDFPCDLSVPQGDASTQSWPYPGCAGVKPVYANPTTNSVPADDPALAGGDAFDLAQLGLTRARYIRIKDAGLAKLGTNSKGLDLDAVVLVHKEKR